MLLKAVGSLGGMGEMQVKDKLFLNDFWFHGLLAALGFLAQS